MRRAAINALLMFGGLLASGAGVTATADASWSSAGCSGEPTHHCYALTTWNISSPRHVYNSWTYIDTTEMYVPEPIHHFVDDEEWLSWPVPYAKDWIEAGQATGVSGTRTKEENEHNPDDEVYEFYAIENKPNAEEPEREEEYEAVSGPYLSLDERNLYEFYVPKVAGEAREGAHWCIKWGPPVFPSSEEGTVRCFTHLHGPAGHLEQGIEAATPTEPGNAGFAEGFAESGKEQLWWNGDHPSQHAELSIYPENARMCEAEHSPGYGSLSFGAGLNCPLGGDSLATGEASPPVGQAFAHYRAESGSRLSLSEVAQIAQAESEAAGDAFATEGSAAEGTLEHALDVMRPSSMEGIRSHSSEREVEYLTSGVYLVELAGEFTLRDAMLPAGDNEPPTGKTLRLVIDAHTGRVEDRWIGGTPGQPLTDLGTPSALGL